ncbi:cytochrome c oxidase assembly protein [Mycolicibacterium rhodesiae]|uniref:Copper resistance protein CopD n=1 Tax=Mycolicibacterium rhodesiae TaxID=36814 RepID=A0A1X0IZM4_MYCRH|nr:cytochrome c oxidase assembly protein [Mycolicibacterium rhodesiae]ORB54756.1 copper resistance protein CopD [Mycolicibacterium rhodesiae]
MVRWSCLVLGIAVWALATFSAVGEYAPVLFWVRALQVLLLLFVAPFLLASARPVAWVCALSPPIGRIVDRTLGSRVMRVALSPLATSAAMLATPWLLYLTPWYVASMTGPLAAGTRVLLVLVGFGYFYTRLQVDPVPRRFSPMLSIGISVVESLADGLLGIVLWLGPLIAVDYYAALHRDWGPSPRTDQSIGAGILWIVGDVLSIPFVVALMRQLGSDERRKAKRTDVELDEATAAGVSGLWWENDPTLRERFSR